MAKFLLHMALVDLGAGSEAGAQRAAGEFHFPLALGEVASRASGEREACDRARDVSVVELLRADLARDHGAEHTPA